MRVVSSCNCMSELTNKAGEVIIAGGNTMRCINVMNKLSESAELLTSCVMLRRQRTTFNLCC